MGTQAVTGEAPVSPTLDLGELARRLASPAPSATCSWRPWIVRLRPGEADRLRAVCREHRVAVIDTIDRQLGELAAVRWPSRSNDAERRRFIDELLSGHGGSESYGNWIYLPWEEKIVHLLERDDYYEVITNRNLDKITREEMVSLRGKRIGVIGLSVGGEAAVTVAQEHLCGAMALADFDRLDLSNLNRLDAGFDELGEKKSTIVARRIVKIDPYLELTVFEDGVTPTNLAAFLDGLDLVIDECDDLQMKRELRLRAKERGLNLVFAADERGFLSVEPYAYQPDLPPFHGRIEGPQLGRDAFPTPLAFMKALTEWMGGWDNISQRSRRSLERIGDTLCGYPQLASEARYAAGQIGNVVRRLLLGERVEPFLGNLDLTDLVPSTAPSDQRTAHSGGSKVSGS
ncbi:MAG: ThiF family adenylyltransferase [Gemmatimonadota bacterium]|nr:MAG: ThiF family adenylyltransferase [Gemmatimonadota bacterium]